jgi:hypothetical protein
MSRRYPVKVHLTRYPGTVLESSRPEERIEKKVDGWLRRPLGEKGEPISISIGRGKGVLISPVFTYIQRQEPKGSIVRSPSLGENFLTLPLQSARGRGTNSPTMTGLGEGLESKFSCRHEEEMIVWVSQYLLS